MSNKRKETAWGAPLVETRPPKRQFAFDKSSATMIVIIATISVSVLWLLSHIPITTSLEMELEITDLAFRVAQNSELPQLLPSAIGARTITLQHFAPIQIDVNKLRKVGESSWIAYADTIVIRPENDGGKLRISSSLADLAISDLFVSSHSKIMLSSADRELFLSVRAQDGLDSARSGATGLISVGKQIMVTLEKCDLLNNRRQPLGKTSIAFNRKIDLAVSEFMPVIDCQAREDRLDLFIEPDESVYADSLEIFNQIRLDNLELIKKTLTSDGSEKSLSTILWGRVRYPGEDRPKVTIEDGESLQYKASAVFLERASLTPNSIKASLLLRGASSLKIGKAGTSRELVDSALDWIRKRPEVGIGYGIIMTILTILSMLRKPEAHGGSN